MKVIGNVSIKSWNRSDDAIRKTSAKIIENNLNKKKNLKII